MNNQKEQNLYIPLSAQAHQLAGKFASEQASLAKGKQVYLNTLAVFAVHRYLKWVGIDTDLSQSDCWNPILRHQWNVADLIIPEVGIIECCPILPGENSISLPGEMPEDRIGYLAIQFNEYLDRVQLLGFTRKAIEGIIQIRNLLPLDEFIEATTPHPAFVNLSSWIADVVDEVWQAVETLLSPQQLAYGNSLRSASRDHPHREGQIDRAKTLALALVAGEQQLTLVVRKWPEENQEFGVAIEVYPINSQDFLPPGLKVKVTLENDSDEEIAGDNDNFIRIPLTEDVGKPITIDISLEDASITEKLIV